MKGLKLPKLPALPRRGPKPLMGTREKRRRKRIISLVLAAALLCGVIAGVRAGLSRRTGKSVNVYEIRDQFAMTDYWGDGSQTDGVVGVEGIQPVYISDTMNVKEVVVENGEEVAEGDTLLTYDTTLTELDVQLKEVKVRQAELDLTNAQKELATIRTYRAGEYIPGSVTRTTIPAAEAVEVEPEEPETGAEAFQEDGTLPLISGDGSFKAPFTYLWKAGYTFDDNFVYQAVRGSNNCYVKFLMVGEGFNQPHVHTPDHKDWYADEKGHFRICSVCGQEYDRAAHSYLVVVDELPDIGRMGSEHEVCGVCAHVGDTRDIPAIDEPEQPTEAPTERPTEAPTERPTEPQTEPPTDPPTEPETEPPTDPPTEPETEPPTEPPTDPPTEPPTDPEEGDGSSPTTGKLQAEVLMQFQRSDYGTDFQIISILIPNADAAVKEPTFDWKEGVPMPSPTEEPTEKPEPEPQPDPEDDEEYVTGIKYTSEELQQMLTEAEAKVRDMDLDLRKMKLEYEQSKRELDNSAIFAEMDGVVRDVMDPAEAKAEDSPVLNVTAGGGYVITCTLSELERDTVQVGQTVSITSWSTDAQVQGTISEISDYPTSDGNYWGAGNANVSYYPFTVQVGEDAGLREGDYVGVQYGAAQGEQGFYLQSMFIRRENGRSYVYVDADGTLEKRYIATGRSLWGSYTQVLSGITPDDRLAFPYGSAVKAGAPTVLASADALYGY